MDIIQPSFTEQAKRIFVGIFFPSIIAVWPTFFVVLQYVNHDNPELKKEIHSISFLISATVVIVMYGIGHFIEKIGARLEIYLEDMFCKSQGKAENRTFEDYRKEFNGRFYEYLSTHFAKDCEPVIVRYYSSMLTGLKFELSLIVSLTIMCLSLFFWNIFYLNLPIMPELIVISVLSLLIIIYLLFEAYTGVYTLDFYREAIVKNFNPATTPVKNEPNPWQVLLFQALKRK